MSNPAPGNGALAIAVVLLITFAHAPWLGTTQAQSSMPKVNLPKVNQINLTEKTAENAMLAFRDFKKKYADTAPPNSDLEAYVRAMLASPEMQTTAKKYGFADTNDWYQNLFSFVIAYFVVTDGDYEQMKLSITRIQDNPDLSEKVKNQLATMLGSLIPPEPNIELAKSMAANPDYSALIAELKE